MENSSWSLNVYCIKRCSCSITKKVRRLRCNGSTLGPMKLHERWWIRCGLCILQCMSVEEKQFWYGVLVYVLVYVFVHVLVMFCICRYVDGCKYLHELCYKSLISDMNVMSLCCHVGLLLSRVIIVNTTSNYLINLHGKYVLFSMVLLGYKCG